MPLQYRKGPSTLSENRRKFLLYFLLFNMKNFAKLSWAVCAFAFAFLTVWTQLIYMEMGRLHFRKKMPFTLFDEKKQISKESSRVFVAFTFAFALAIALGWPVPILTHTVPAVHGLRIWVWAWNSTRSAELDCTPRGTLHLLTYVPRPRSEWHSYWRQWYCYLIRLLVFSEQKKKAKAKHKVMSWN